MADATAMTNKGQVTVPREFRDRFGLKSGDKMAFTMLSDGTVVMQTKTRRLADLAGVADARGAAQGRRRGHEPVPGDDSNKNDEANFAMNNHPAAPAARAAARSERVAR